MCIGPDVTSFVAVGAAFFLRELATSFANTYWPLDTNVASLKIKGQLFSLLVCKCHIADVNAKRATVHMLDPTAVAAALSCKGTESSHGRILTEVKL